MSSRTEGIEAALLQIGLGRDAKDAALTIRAHLMICSACSRAIPAWMRRLTTYRRVFTLSSK